MKKRGKKLLLHMEFLLTIGISLLGVLSTSMTIEMESLNYAKGVAHEYQRLENSYISVFQSIEMQTEEVLATNPSPEELQNWLLKQNNQFGMIVGEDVYDGFYLTYQGEFVHSWDYGNYENYDPSSRIWYQNAEAAGGEVAIVAPYVTYLDPQYIQSDQYIEMSVVQKYSEDITLGMDLKIVEIGGLLKDRSLNYQGSNAVLVDRNGYILSATIPDWYCHNINQEDEIISVNYCHFFQDMKSKAGTLQYKFIENDLYLSYAQVDSQGNMICTMIPFWSVFTHNYLPLLLIGILLLLVESMIYGAGIRRIKILTEKEEQIEAITSAAFERHLLVDTDTMKCVCDSITEKEMGTDDYQLIYERLQLMIRTEEAKEDFTSFLSPKAIKNASMIGLISKKFPIIRSQEDSNIDTVYQYGRIISKVNNKRIVTIYRNDISEEEMRRHHVLQTFAHHYLDVFVGNIRTKRYEVIKSDYNTNRKMDHEMNLETIRREYANSMLKESFRQLYIDTLAFDNVEKRLSEERSFSITVQGIDEHWFTIYIIRSIDYETTHEFLFCVENADEQMQQQEKLKIALKQAKSATKAKSDFLSRMSHDIRTPLNGILGMTTIAQDKNREPQVKECLDTIQASGTFLLNLLNNILDLSKIESGNMKLTEAPMNFSEFDHLIYAMITPLMAEKNIRFECQLTNTDRRYCMDYTRFNQIFLNLLSNAAKYTQRDGTVSFTSEIMTSGENIEWVRFLVKDNGIGMSKEFVEKAFIPFEQGYDPGEQNQKKGTGLGLAIVKELVSLMGGHIQIESKLQQGTTFTVELPLKITDRVEKMIQSDDKLAQLLNEKTILVVEDNIINAMVTSKMLEKYHIKVMTAGDGKEAVDIIKNKQEAEEEKIDLILMDMRMPVMNGIEATRQIRLLGDTTPIIAMTANAFAEDMQMCLESGMDDYLTKPVDANLLYQILGKYISESEKSAKHSDDN